MWCRTGQVGWNTPSKTGSAQPVRVTIIYATTCLSRSTGVEGDTLSRHHTNLNKWVGFPYMCQWKRMMGQLLKGNRESQFDTYPTPRVDDSTMQNPSPHNLYQYLYIIHQPSPSQFLEAWLSQWMHTVHCWTLPVKSHLGQHKYPPTSDLTWGHWQVPVAKGMCHKSTYVLPLATSSLQSHY